MTLSNALNALKTSLGERLPGWKINVDEIDYPVDKMCDIIYGNSDMRYLDMGTRAYVGYLSFYHYRNYRESYTELLNDVDSLTAWLDEYENDEMFIGGNSEIVANIGTLEGALDNNTRF